MKTNNIKNWLLVFSVGCGFASAITSCADLDSDKYFVDRKTLESVFDDRVQVDQWLAHAYSFLNGVNFEVCSKGGTGGDGSDWNPFCFADDIYYGDRDNTFGDRKDADWASYNSFREGNYNEGVGHNAWVRCYQGINQATSFIHNIDLNTKMKAEEIDDYRGQARFVRAYYYWLLLRKYGPIPILPDEGVDYTADYEVLSYPRSSYEECAQWIADEMLKAANELKAVGQRDEDNICRPSKGTCLAARAIVYTYAASPLANGQLKNGKHPASVTDNIARELKNTDGKYLLSLDYDDTKWARAAAACKDVIDLGVYELHTTGFNPQGEPGRPETVTPHNDPEFSVNDWPNGWRNIDPYLSYADLFNGNVSPRDPEIIFSRGSNMGQNDNDNGINALVLHEMPYSMGGWNTHGMTQKMVDTYYMWDGKDIDGMYSEWRSPGEMGNDRPRPQGNVPRSEITSSDFNYHKEILADQTQSASTQNSYRMSISKQYASREPRFYASVGYHGSIWEKLDDNRENASHNVAIWYYRGTENGYKNTFSFLRTGIGIKKFYNPHDWATTNGDYGHLRQKWEPAIRYADILLMYAECINELEKGKSYDVKDWRGNAYAITRDINEIKRGVRPVRIRAGLHDYDFHPEDATIYDDPDAIRTRIKRERMIEFMGEGKRYFDLRRWMDAPIEENKRIYGLNVFMDESTAQNKLDFMKVIPVYNLSAVFTDKMYFWPISFDDLKKNPNLVQNPGWQYND
jgi:hypothetical protein